MTKYLIQRLVTAIPTLLAISAVVFTILALAPGDPMAEFGSNPNIPAEVRQNIRRQLGLDEPVYIRYVKWLTALLQGNWGYSFASRTGVLDLIFQRLPTTLYVVGTAYLISVLIAIPVGVISAVKQYSVLDHMLTTITFIGFSLPTFFTGLLLIIIFSVKLRWLPFIYSTTLQGEGLGLVWEYIKQAAMPVTVLALFQSASLARFVRAAVLDVVRLDYVRVARAKGLGEAQVILGHVMRNALIPVVTLVALNTPAVFTGAVITEQIFRVPGIGSLLIASIERSDTPVVMAITFIYAVLVVVFNLVADILYGVLDPRIRFD